jgi:hypothetical protein
MKRSAHKDIVTEMTTQLEMPAATLKLDITLGTLRNRSVGWMVNAYHDINNKDLILKVRQLTSCWWAYLTLMGVGTMSRR